MKPSREYPSSLSNDHSAGQIAFQQSRYVNSKLKITIKMLTFHNSKLLSEPTELSFQLVEYVSDTVLRKIGSLLVYSFDSEAKNCSLDVEIPFLVKDIFSRDFKVLITMKNFLKSNSGAPKTYSLLVNVTEGKINKLAQGLRLFKFTDFDRTTLIYDNTIDKINSHLVKADYDVKYLDALLCEKLDNLDEYMTFDDIEKGCNFLLLSFPLYEYPIILNDKIKVNNDTFYHSTKPATLTSNQNYLASKPNSQANEFINIGSNFDMLKFQDPLQYSSAKNPAREKKEMVLRMKPVKNSSRRPINDLNPGFLTKLLLERFVDATKYNLGNDSYESNVETASQSVGIFDDIIATSINKHDILDLKWLNIENFQDLHQVLQENNKDHSSFKKKLIWEFRAYILSKLDSDGSGMLTILSNISWNDLLLLPKSFLLRRRSDLNIFTENLTALFRNYDFKKVSVEVLLQLFRFKLPLLLENVFEDCIYYNEENTEEIRTCIHSLLQQALHESFTIKVMETLQIKDFQLYLLHIVEGICWDYKNVDYFDIQIDEEDIEDDQILEEEFVIDGNKFSVPKSITLSEPSIVMTVSPLSLFLISKGLKSFIEIGNHLYWYLKVQLLYSNKIQDLIDHYEYELADDEKIVLSLQKELLHAIDMVNQKMRTYIPGAVKNMSKQDYLVTLINSELNSFIKSHAKTGDLLRLPILPDYKIIAIKATECRIFKSSLQPIKLSFQLAALSTNKPRDFSVIYKNGDDLKQDQLISNIIKIMDSLLLQDNVNLNIKTYDILPMGLNMGMIEFIESETVSNILTTDASIKNFLSKKAKLTNVSEAELTNVFVKSTAAYSVITYLLGVGDRHLENLLITPKGEFFHADFGYILGNDPKLFPPLMKLPPQIVEGFGGTKDSNAKYDEFRGYCFACFLVLRRHSALLIDLFKFIDLNSTPIAANIPSKGKPQVLPPQRTVSADTKSFNNPNINILKNDYNKFVDKFQLEMSEDDAILYLQNLINSSINALLPLVIDHLHNLAQYWRN